MKRQVCRVPLIVVSLCSLISAGPASGSFVDMDPDNGDYFVQNGVVDGHGVTIRTWSANPPSPLSVWDQPWNKLYARSPYVGGAPWLGMEPSTGDLMFGGYGQVNLHGTTLLGGNIHFLFDSPTNFVSIDICWPRWDWTEGAWFYAWTEDPNGVESVAYGLRLLEGGAGTSTRMSLFYPGITRVRIFAYDDTTTAQGQSFGLDNLQFIDTDSASLHLDDGEQIVAPEGLNIGTGHSLTGQGTVVGDVINMGGTVSPGSSPGDINVTGGYEQDADGYLLMEIADGVSDHLFVHETAALAGTLEIALLDGFIPEDGESFPLITYGDRDGEFDDILGLSFDGGFFTPTYGAGGFLVTATIIPAPTAVVGFAVAMGLAISRRRPAATQ